MEACRVKIKAANDEDPNYVRGILLSAVHLARCKQLPSAIKVLEVCNPGIDIFTMPSFIHTEICELGLQKIL